MTVVFFAFLAGITILITSAERFIEGSVAASRHYSVSTFLVGILVVGFGTSAPELAISTFASFQEKPDIALGNAYGSNIANIGLIIGVTALIRPIALGSKIVKNELFILATCTLIAIYQLLDGQVSRIDGAILITLFATIMCWLISQSKKTVQDPIEPELARALSKKTISIKAAIFWIIIGIAGLVVGSQLIVWSAIEIARYFHVSELIISLTVVAIGTSLPELASSIAASLKKEDDLIIGNIVGSNLFNTMAVVGISATIYPIPVQYDFIIRDCSIMALLTASLFVCGPGKISRLEGGVLSIAYFSYLLYLAYF